MSMQPHEPTQEEILQMAQEMADHPAEVATMMSGMIAAEPDFTNAMFGAVGLAFLDIQTGECKDCQCSVCISLRACMEGIDAKMSELASGD